jgi:23S rRNA pseudouridine1911/1915/1917 synthase
LPQSIRSFRVDNYDAGLRVDQFLAEKATDLSRIGIGNLIAAGACTVNGVVTRAGHHIAAGDSIDLLVNDDLPGAMSPDLVPLEILFEDDHLLVVVKPAGMLVHPTQSVKRGTLANALSYHLNVSRTSARKPESLNNEAPTGRTHQQIVRPGIVHRLDRATSGLMVVAKNQRALSLLSRHFSRRLVEKKYMALVRGRVAGDSGRVDAPVGRDPEAVPHWRVLESGKPAETIFSVLARGENTTLVELKPVTGRTNQLRIHMACIGHPIVGDESWDKVAGDEDSRVERWRGSAASSSAASRLLLHASQLGFHHPVGGEWLEFSSTPGQEFGVW